MSLLREKQVIKNDHTFICLSIQPDYSQAYYYANAMEWGLFYSKRLTISVEYFHFGAYNFFENVIAIFAHSSVRLNGDCLNSNFKFFVPASVSLHHHSMMPPCVQGEVFQPDVAFCIQVKKVSFDQSSLFHMLAVFPLWLVTNNKQDLLRLSSNNDFLFATLP